MYIADIDKQIAELQAKKQQLIEKEKDAALEKVMAAIQELNALGYHYELHNAGAKPTRQRRSGVRDSVLNALKAKPGSKPADIAAALDMDDKAGKQSIANALSALKKSGAVTADAGAYTAV